MLSHRWLLLAAWLSSVLLLQAAPAQDTTPDDSAPDVAPKSAAAVEDIARWVADLDSADFKVRQTATEKLIAAGTAAVAPVVAAAEGESLEVTTRAIEVLKTLADSNDEAVKSAARKGLESLAKSDNRAAARKANAILNPPQPPQPPNPFGQIQIQAIQIQQAGNRRVKIRNANGQKTIEAEEDGKQVKIEIDPAGAIKMSVTEKVDGQDKTSEYTAKNADELKKNHPDAHKLFEKYNQNNPAIQVQIGGGGVFRGIRPPRRLRMVPQETLDEIEAARKELQQTADQMRKLAESAKVPPEEIRALADRLDAAREKLDAARKRLGE